MALDTTPKAPIQGTRSKRDRFVAFAFCWADALFELNEDQEVTFVAGATEALIGCAAGELMGKNFMDLVDQSDRTLTQQLINIAKKEDASRMRPFDWSVMIRSHHLCHLLATGWATLGIISF